MRRWSAQLQFMLALLAASLVSLSLFAYGAWRNHSLEFGYLVWNLFLAWLPLMFALRLLVVLRQKRWSSWEGIGWSLLWLIFLPNSFYMISDFIHLQDVGRVDLLYDTIMFTAFIYAGVVLGFSSLYLIHRQFKRRLPDRTAAAWITATLFICSVAIYVGRDLRWNSWDVLFNPGGLLFDISDRLMHLSTYPHMLLIISSFFLLLAGMYFMLWRAALVLERGVEQ
jgi:uncharacterized membrane protein